MKKQTTYLIVGAVGIGLVWYLLGKRGEAEGENAGYLDGVWFYYQDGMTNWERLSAGTLLDAGVETYFSALGTNKSEVARKVHIDMVLANGGSIALPVSENQDKLANPDEGWSVGFGPVVLEPYDYTLYAALKIGGQEVDTGTISFTV